ncbi:hypothetical protein LCGC14_0846870 [marine sediment metagenome]|uniref:Uncharacterized protein n=1 Tax=marine sediment metagenome TaxID=412755 RepID=A0A0F9RWB2_9ZZZZ
MKSPKQRAVSRSKSAERRLARIVGGKRNPTTGKAVIDVETETEAFGLKSWGSLPAWLHEAWEQTESDAARVDKSPILVLEECRTGGKNVRYYVKREDAWLAQNRGSS